MFGKTFSLFKKKKKIKPVTKEMYTRINFETRSL